MPGAYYFVWKSSQFVGSFVVLSFSYSVMNSWKPAITCMEPKKTHLIGLLGYLRLKAGKKIGLLMDERGI